MRNSELTYEHPEFEVSWEFNYFFNAIWLSFVTMTTVGYGDGYPATTFGRLYAIILCFLGQILISVLMNMLFRYVALNAKELKALHILKRS